MTEQEQRQLKMLVEEWKARALALGERAEFDVGFMEGAFAYRHCVEEIEKIFPEIKDAVV
jgi:hypothetical protein